MVRGYCITLTIGAMQIRVIATPTIRPPILPITASPTYLSGAKNARVKAIRIAAATKATKMRVKESAIRIKNAVIAKAKTKQ